MQFPREAIEAVRSPEAGIRGNFELPDMDTRNQTWVLCEMSKLSFLFVTFFVLSVLAHISMYVYVLTIRAAFLSLKTPLRWASVGTVPPLPNVPTCLLALRLNLFKTAL